MARSFVEAAFLATLTLTWAAMEVIAYRSREGEEVGEQKKFFVGGIYMREGSYMQSRKRSEMGWGTVEVWGCHLNSARPATPSH